MNLNHKKDILSTSIEYLKGIGPSKGDLLRKERNIHTYGDLLTDFPFRYIDRSVFTPISQIGYQLDAVQIKGKLVDLREVPMGKRTRLEGILKDQTGSVKLIWFQSVKWILKSLELNAQYIAYGRVNKFKSLLSIPHPEMESVHNSSADKPSFEPVYHSTDKLNSNCLSAFSNTNKSHFNRRRVTHNFNGSSRTRRRKIPIRLSCRFTAYRL